MPYRSTDHLLKLIERLTPAEKRQFKINVKKNNQKGEVLFLSLFDVMEDNNEKAIKLLSLSAKTSIMP